MVSPLDIDSILDTYELSPRLRKSVQFLAFEALKSFRVVTFDESYSLIAELIERRSHNSKERFFRRLDQQAFHDAYLTLHEICSFEDTGNDDHNNGDLLDGEKEETGLTIRELVGLLSGSLDPQKLKVLELLARGSEGTLSGLSSDVALKKVPEIDALLDELVRTFEFHGVVLIPPRPIIEIRWDPRLYVRFGTRRYNGNPFGFYEAHPDVYGGMTRGQLKLFDQGLYCALRDAGQLPKVPTKLVKPYGDDPLAYFRTHEQKYRGMNRSQFMRANSGLEKALRRNGQLDLVIPNDYHLTDEDKRRIVVAYPTYRGNCSKTAKALGFCRESVKRCWEESGVIEEEMRRVLGTYWEFNGSALAASRALPYCRTTITARWKDAGLPVREKGQTTDFQVPDRETFFKKGA